MSNSSRLVPVFLSPTAKTRAAHPTVRDIHDTRSPFKGNPSVKVMWRLSLEGTPSMLGAVSFRVCHAQARPQSNDCSVPGLLTSASGRTVKSPCSCKGMARALPLSTTAGQVFFFLGGRLVPTHLQAERRKPPQSDM